MTQFDKDISLTQISETAYALEIADTWQIKVGPNGGYIAAIMLNGMKQAIGDIQTRSFTCHFLSPSIPGPARLSLSIEKQGRTLSTATIKLLQNQKTIAFAIATFANDRDDTCDNEVTMPKVASPNDVPEADYMTVGKSHYVPFRSKYDQRPALGPKPGTLSGAAKLGGWTRFVEARPFDDLALLAISDSWYPSVFAKVDDAIHIPTIDHTVHFLNQPAALEQSNPEAFVFVLFQTETINQGYLIEDGFIWSESGTPLARSRQLAIILPR